MQKNEISPSVYRNIIVSKDNVQVLILRTLFALTGEGIDSR